MSANNRAGGQHSKWYISDSFPSPQRASRITARLEELIAKKKGKIEIQDMINIMQDNVDFEGIRNLQSLRRILAENYEQVAQKY